MRAQFIRLSAELSAALPLSFLQLPLLRLGIAYAGLRGVQDAVVHSLAGGAVLHQSLFPLLRHRSHVLDASVLGLALCILLGAYALLQDVVARARVALLHGRIVYALLACEFAVGGA